VLSLRRSCDVSIHCPALLFAARAFFVSVSFCCLDNVRYQVFAWCGGVHAHQLAAAAAVLGWRQPPKVDQGAVTAAAVVCAGRIRSLPLARAALEGYLRARWRAAAV